MTLFDITPAQARAARALIGWTQNQLADVSGVPLRSVVRFEVGETMTRLRTVAAMRLALEAAGIEFIADSRGVGVLARRVAPDA